MGQPNIDKALKFVAKLSIDKASQVLSKTIKAGATIELEDVFLADISEITSQVIKYESNEVVGAFIDLVGSAQFNFLFYVNLTDSLIVTDLMLRREIGTTKELDLYAKSSVQELGNIISSAISNVFVSDFQISLKPTPPVVVHDYASTVFEEFILRSSPEKDEILIIESIFKVIQHDIRCKMFLLPAGDSDKLLADIANSI